MFYYFKSFICTVKVPVRKRFKRFKYIKEKGSEDLNLILGLLEIESSLKLGSSLKVESSLKAGSLLEVESSEKPSYLLD